MIDFDDLFFSSVEVNPEPRGPGPTAGLVVAEKATNSRVLEVEAMIHRETYGLPTVVFVEEDSDDPTKEVFANARAFADAMHLSPGMLPTEAQAAAWASALKADAYAKHYDKLAEAYQK